jgi:hypothetical protein
MMREIMLMKESKYSLEKAQEESFLLQKKIDSGEASDFEEAQALSEAKSKIREFVNDPKLKFHFSPSDRIPSILAKGILSYQFGKRIGMDIPENLGVRVGGSYTEPRSISIVDREKNQNAGYKDWWIKKFTNETVNIGFLLPNDLKIRDKTPQPNESLAAIRIKPDLIQGLFVVESPELFETMKQRTERMLKEFPKYAYTPSLYLLKRYFDINQEELRKKYPEMEPALQGFKKRWSALFGKYRGVHWPEEARAEFRQIEKEEWEFIEQFGKREMEQVLGKPIEEISELDCLEFFAKRSKLPVYGVDKDFQSQKVLWPK